MRELLVLKRMMPSGYHLTTIRGHRPFPARAALKWTSSRTFLSFYQGHLGSLTSEIFPDQHPSSSSEENPDPVRRQAALHPAWQDQDVRPLEGQGQDQAQEALVSVHVHVLPAWTSSYGAAHFRGSQGSAGREHLHPHPGRRHRLPAPGRQLVGRLDEKEQEPGSGLWSNPPRRIWTHGLVPALRVCHRSLAAKGDGAHDRLCHVFARMLLALQSQGLDGRQRHEEVHHQVGGSLALRPVRSGEVFCYSKYLCSFFL